MSSSAKYALRFVLITAAIAAVSLGIVYRTSDSQTYASGKIVPTSDKANVDPPLLDDLEGNGAEQFTPAACDNTACNNACWAGGTHSNTGTTAVMTNKQPKSCPAHTGGCVTQACAPTCANTACNSACWADGTHAANGSVATRTVKQMNDCPPNTGGCVTRTCQ